MVEEKVQAKKTLSLSSKTLELKKPVDNKSMGKSGVSSYSRKTVAVEVKKNRSFEKAPIASAPPEEQKQQQNPAASPDLNQQNEQTQSKEIHTSENEVRERKPSPSTPERRQPINRATAARAQALFSARQSDEKGSDRHRIQDALRQAQEQQRKLDDEHRNLLDAQKDRKAEKEMQEAQLEVAKSESASAKKPSHTAKTEVQDQAQKEAEILEALNESRKTSTKEKTYHLEDEEEGKNAGKKAALKSTVKRDVFDRHHLKISIDEVLHEEEEVLSLTDDKPEAPKYMPMRRHKPKHKKTYDNREKVKIFREVLLPDFITVQELSNRMSEKTPDVIKTLMKLGVMATINQTIEADIAEIVATEMGHKIKRISESSVEEGLSVEDKPEDLITRPPVVTIMGHVDHGKTSLLDALRETDVVSREAGGITQHIGAYQIQLADSRKITFIDTPGHAAFTEMRARGANVTDIVVLVVAADDGIMPQTVEAISHAKAANVPIIVAINKCDLPSANPSRVKQELLQHEIVVEDMGGDVLCVEVSAKAKLNLDKLEEMILIQADVLDLKANPHRTVHGVVVEAKMEVGKGPVGTILIQHGTLSVGDIFVAGTNWGRVRGIVNDKGKSLKQALPSDPVEIIGLNAVPRAGDDFIVVPTESKAREVGEYRLRKQRDRENALAVRATSGGDILNKIQRSKIKELYVILKADVHGSIEAITSSLEKLTETNEEVKINILHKSVGAISESDITLGNASNALIIGFNVRANNAARDLARKEKVEIKYYSIIYNIIDDIKAALSGLLSPTLKETFLGYAEIREVFNITKVGKVAGCMVTSGVIKRGAGVRLLRDNVVIHEGKLKTLKRFKDEVKEVKENYECGMAFENYDDIKPSDVIEAYEIETIQRTI